MLKCYYRAYFFYHKHLCHDVLFNMSVLCMFLYQFCKNIRCFCQYCLCLLRSSFFAFFCPACIQDAHVWRFYDLDFFVLCFPVGSKANVQLPCTFLEWTRICLPYLKLQLRVCPFPGGQGPGMLLSVLAPLGFPTLTPVRHHLLSFILPQSPPTVPLLTPRNLLMY